MRASWGDASRHYAQASSLKGSSGAGRSSETEERWATLLEQSSPGVRGQVERAARQWNGIVRDLIRTETGFRLTVGSESQAVPLHIVDGMPRPFAEALGELSGLEWLILNRPALEDTVRGTGFLREHLSAWRAQLPPVGHLAETAEVESVYLMARGLLEALDKANAIRRLLGIQEDVLGAYYFRVPEVRIYWLVIGIVAAAINVPIEALTIVVLAHELTHAYSHLGRDIDAEQWDTNAFAAADLEIIEGIAQFYASVVCQRLESRAPRALQAYSALLERQSGPYLAHTKWLSDDERGGEIMRVSMIECRSLGITSHAAFQQAIARHRKQVKGRTGPAQVGTE